MRTHPALALLFVVIMTTDAGASAMAKIVAARISWDFVVKGREIVTLMKNAWAILCAEKKVVLVQDLKVEMTVANNQKEMRASTAEQTMSALVLLFVATMTTNAGKNVQAGTNVAVRA